MTIVLVLITNMNDYYMYSYHIVYYDMSAIILRMLYYEILLTSRIS